MPPFLPEERKAHETPILFPHSLPTTPSNTNNFDCRNPKIWMERGMSFSLSFVQTVANIIHAPYVQTCVEVMNCSAPIYGAEQMRPCSSYKGKRPSVDLIRGKGCLPSSTYDGQQAAASALADGGADLAEVIRVGWCLGGY